MTGPTSTGRVVADSNLLFSLVVPLAYSEAAQVVFRRWLENRLEVVAPALWRYEAVSALRKVTTIQGLTKTEQEDILSLLYVLPVRSIEANYELHRSSLAWAERLGTTVAYDSTFVALAEMLDAELWTADRRLARQVAEVAEVPVHYLLDADSVGGSPPTGS